jgi:hypothetical protein
LEPRILRAWPESLFLFVSLLTLLLVFLALVLLGFHLFFLDYYLLFVFVGYAFLLCTSDREKKA